MKLAKESMGMSRAAQKKRKHQKLLISAADQADDNTSSHHGIMKKSKQLGTFDIWSKTLLPPIWMNDTVVDIPTIDFVSVIKLRDAIDITADQRAAVLFSKMTYPVTRSSFYTTYWNKLPLHVERNDNQYFKEVITKKSLSTILNGQLLLESVDVLVAKYNDEWDSEHQTYKSKFDWKSQSNQSLEHQSFNKSDFEDVQKRGFVVSFLCPQKYNDRIWKLISLMEPEFNCRIEANVVLCPANATGCSYRYHGFDQFICQLEGTSIWTLFRPPTEKELPRGLICEVNPLEYLATNGSSDVKAYREVSLKAGDFLYIPKGWVLKQENREPLACTYLCLNTNFDNSMADLFEILVPHTLADILADTISLRRSLPANSFSYLGIAHSEVENSESRLAFQFECNKALQLFADRALDLVDPAVDQIKKKFVIERLPIPLSKREELLTCSGSPDVTILPYTKLRILRPNAAIGVVEDGKVVVYHCMDNSRELFGSAVNPLEFELDDGPTIEALLMAYPEGVVVSELNHPSEDIEDKVAIAQALYKEGILIIEDEATAPSSAVGKSAESIKQAAENEVNDDESKNVEAGENKKLSLFDD